MPSFDRILEQFCSRPGLEAEWLDMLAQMEYVGCRKILKAVPFERVNLSVLTHAMEEASHSFLLKSLVEKLGVKNRAWSESALSQIGWTYFQALDHGVSRLQGDAFHYPTVSWFVEQRVLDIYPKYVGLTRHLSVRRVLQRILAQEKRHGTQFGDAEFPAEFKQRASELESGLWSELVNGLEAWLGTMLK